jgi:glycosyltransferase involved in cell wall biosynthesis
MTLNNSNLISKKEFRNLKNEISVLCVSYNFKKSIKKCLDSILSQITSIPIKIYSIDDGSNDGTQEILAKYADKNKKIIKLIHSNTNTKKPGNLLLLDKYNIDFNSKYFCIIDGDDYWIDNYNLQKKLQVLINNEKIIGCSSITKMINKNKIFLIKAGKTLFNKSDLIAHGNTTSFYCHTSSLLWKNYYYNKKNKLPFPPHFTATDGDTFLFNQMLNNGHSINVLPEVLSVYNYNGQGAWSSLPKETKNKMNKKLMRRIFIFAPLKYKIFYIIIKVYNFFKFEKKKLFNLFFLIFKIRPINEE